MSLFDSASLVITPNGYKEGKLYSIKPIDGSGDLSVVRATSATRVNSAGLIDEVPYNLARYSEQFDNAYWVKALSSVTANATTAPNGTLTADKLNETAVNGYHLLTGPNNIISSTYTSSVYVKKAERNFVMLWNGGVNSGRIFDLENGTLGGSINSAPLDSKIEALPDGWFKCTITNNNATSFSIYNAITSTSAFYLGEVGKGVYIWGAQMVYGSSEKEYLKTTDRLNIPRLDYTGSTCPSILVEPQRTNLCLFSEDLTNSNWVKTRCNIAANSILSPNGTLTSDKFTETTFTNNFSGLEKQIIVTNGTTYCSSAFFKKGNVRYAIVSYFIVGGNQGRIIVDLDTKELTYSSNVSSYKIEQFANDYVRISITITANAANSCYFGYLHTKISNNYIYNGDGTGFTYLWGAQVEAGANATSYIATGAASVTRNADVISKTGISSLIGQTEGTVYCDMNFNNSASKTEVNRIIELTDGTNSNRIIIAFGSINTLLTRLTSSGVEQASFSASSIYIGRLKIALSYSSNGVKFFVNGALIQSNLSATIPTTSRLNLGYQGISNTQQLNDSINLASIWKTALTDSECIELTTL